MSGEVSYFSRFFVKFVEIIAAGVASAISAYLLAHFGVVLLSSPTPASAPVAPIASEVAESRRAQPAPPALRQSQGSHPSILRRHACHIPRAAMSCSLRCQRSRDRGDGEMGRLNRSESVAHMVHRLINSNRSGQLM